MTKLEIFTKALGLESPWEISEVTFKDGDDGEELHLDISYSKGVKFEYENAEHTVYDHQERSWRHLNFFVHHCYIHARVPRVKLSSGSVRLIQVPWAQQGSSFTLLFERNAAVLVHQGMSVLRAAYHLDIGAGIVRRIIKRQAIEALATQELEAVKQLGIDETSSKKGHNYLTIATDRERKKVVGISVGKTTASMEEAIEEMEFRGASRNDVKCITMDMSKAYIAGAQKLLGKADIVFDRYHIAALLNKAVDQVRREEQKQFAELKKSRYLWLNNPNRLNEKKESRLQYLAQTYPTIGEAYRLKELFRKILNEAHKNHRLTPLNEWMKLAWDTQIKPLQDFVKMLSNHWYGIKTYFKRLATNAFAERVNLKIQEIKRIAKGYRNMENFKLLRLLLIFSGSSSLL